MRSRDSDPLINIHVAQFKVYLRLQDPREGELGFLRDSGNAFGQAAIRGSAAKGVSQTDAQHEMILKVTGQSDADGWTVPLVRITLDDRHPRYIEAQGIFAG